MKPPVVALLTDFGHKDHYVGVMKGVLLSVCPDARIVDLCHEVAPQDVEGASFLLKGAWPWFPEGTVFVSVVDPGVGSGRAVVAMEAERRIFLAPDNGLLGFLRDRARRIVRVENEALFLKPLSRTFHGRDLFAPVAGRLARGLDLAKLGPRAASIRGRDLPRPRAVGDGLEGRIMAVDTFGNLITNVPGAGLREPLAIRVGRSRIGRMRKAYAEAKVGELFGIVGSTGRLEISVNRGSAARKTGARVGDPVRVKKA